MSSITTYSKVFQIVTDLIGNATETTTLPNNNPPVNNSTPPTVSKNVGNQSSVKGSQVTRAKAKYGLPPQEGGKIPLVSFWTPYPIFYSGVPVSNKQNATNQKTKKSISVKLSDLTWNKTNKVWTDPNGVYGDSTNTYTTKVDNKIIVLKVHELEKSSIEKCFVDIKKEYSLEEIYQYGFNTSSGTYVARNTRNGNSYSMHSWGIAIDMCAALNPNTYTKTASFRAATAKKFLDVMESNGWYSGGRAWDRDYMHFQTVKP
jgi:hypothetical protein